MVNEFTIHSGWGDHIDWSHPSEFDGDTNREFHVDGHLPGRLPRVGDILVGEFKRSWITFEFTEVTYMFDPQDQFFGKVKAIKQDLK